LREFLPDDLDQRVRIYDLQLRFALGVVHSPEILGSYIMGGYPAKQLPFQVSAVNRSPPQQQIATSTTMSIKQATLPGLPTDIKLIVLCYLADFRTLCILLDSSEAYRDAFREYPAGVLQSVQKNEYFDYQRACIPDALALIASTVLADDSKPVEDVRAFISLYRKTTSRTWREKDILEEISAWFTNSDFPVEFGPQDVQQMCSQHDAVEQLADDFLSDLNRRLPSDSSVTTLDNPEPSERERARARQALYRLWIHWNLFRPRVIETRTLEQRPGMKLVRTILQSPIEELQVDFISSFSSVWDAENVALAFRYFHSGVKSSVGIMLQHTPDDGDLTQLLQGK
jgi:hypothetical protein